MAIVLLALWSIYLPFYKEKTIDLASNEDKLFSPECSSIVLNTDGNKAILFIHGFPTTPYMYKWATEYAHKCGYNVFAPLIPSFGSDWHDMVKTNFSSWFKYIDGCYQNIRTEYDKVYVVGVSMGGAMTLKLAEKYSNTDLRMDAIAVFASPVVYNSLKDRVITAPLAYAGRILKIFIPSLGAKCITENPKHNDGDQFWHGYKGVFARQGISLIYNLKDIRQNLGKIKVPMLAGHDRNDKTVPYGNLQIIKDETSTESVFITTEIGKENLHSHHALLTYDSTKQELMDRVLEFFLYR